MKVVIKEPGYLPKEAQIENNLKALQNLVEGYIEHVNVNEDIGMIVNEEGKLRGLDPNFEFRGDMIVGTAVFVGYGEDGDFADVPATAPEIYYDVIPGEVLI